MDILDLPGGPVVKNSPANAGDMDSVHGPGGFDMLQGNQDCEPQHRSLHSRACALLQEKPLQQDARLLQLEKAHTQRPSAGKNKRKEGGNERKEHLQHIYTEP